MVSAVVKIHWEHAWLDKFSPRMHQERVKSKASETKNTHIRAVQILFTLQNVLIPSS